MITFLLVGVFVKVEYSKKTNYVVAPNVMVDDTVYWFSRSYSDPLLLEKFDFTGITQISESHIADVNFSANGVAAGAEVYQSADYPGWVYIKWGQHINRFTVWELSYPLIQYNGSIYVAVNEFRNSMAGNERERIRVKNYSAEYEVVGTLSSGEVDSVPTSNFEANSQEYWGQKLYCNPNDTSTIYADANYAGTMRREPFYKASLIPIEYEPYIKVLDF